MPGPIRVVVAKPGLDGHDRGAKVVARALRDRAGTLSGHALGEDPEPADAAPTLLADVLAVVPASETRVWNQTVVARLAELRPEAYGGWEAEQLTTAPGATAPSWSASPAARCRRSRRRS